MRSNNIKNIIAFGKLLSIGNSDVIFKDSSITHQ